MNQAALLAKLKELLQTKSVVEQFGPSSEPGQAWLADVRAYLEQVDGTLAAQFAHWTFYVVMPLSNYTLGPIWTNMQGLLRTAIARLELELPQQSGKLYAPGEAYDVYRDLSRIIAAAKQNVFLVDAYADEEVFDLYLAKLDTAVEIRLLTKPPSTALKLVAKKFGARPGIQFEARGTMGTHDRVLIIDSADCWVMGQSIKDAAAKKPTYLLPVDAVKDMVNLYEDAWRLAQPY